MEFKQPLDKLCCLNEECSGYGRRGLGNLSVCAWLGKWRDIRQLYCRLCRKKFSERKGTPLYDLKLPADKVVAVLEHIREGCGVRQTGRLVGVGKDTVTRLVLRAGRHAQALHEELVPFSPSNQRGAVRRKVGLRRQEGGPL